MCPRDFKGVNHESLEDEIVVSDKPANQVLVFGDNKLWKILENSDSRCQKDTWICILVKSFLEK